MEPKWQAEKFEEEIYQLWKKSGFFNPDNLPGKRKKKFVIAIPPPNITGSLHMGHALNSTIQDILIRYHRLKGEKTLWVPGTDHAGIATQNVVEKELAKKGITRKNIGREKFLEYVWQWKEKYGNIILSQFEKLGCSCDWSRTRFTLDDDYSIAVEKAFFHYYQKGYIYRGPRLVNWCPRCETAISDIEIKYKEEKTKLYYIKYKIKNSNLIQNSEYIIVATTRPETMLGDTAIAVNPKDKRYKNLIGKTAILPIVNREIPIIANHFVDPQFGTGAVKITPAHDALDWKIGQTHKLKIINVIGPQAKMTDEAGKYKGLPVLEARQKIKEELERLKLLVKEEDYTHHLSLCDRCLTPIEPQISTQWFIKMDKLVRPAIKVVKQGKIKIIPSRLEKLYFNWLQNIEDWCISRQLWWGHRLPVWQCQAENSKSAHQNQKTNFIVSINKPKEKCPICNSEYEQVPDVLDTWFSSALWPFAILGWPKKTKDLKNFYPTDFLTTAQEILYLWVSRMIFSSLEFTGKIPFSTVYIHPTILNPEGRRMSKSLGTGVDPLNLIKNYGADATRWSLIFNLTPEQQSIKFDERSLVGARNFVNKIYNIARFIKMQDSIDTDFSKEKINYKNLTPADIQILSRLNEIIISVTSKIEQYELGKAAQELYQFSWHELADIYIETAKKQIKNAELKDQTIKILYLILFDLLKLLHPFIPFVTEKIWQEFHPNEKANLLLIQDWPKSISRSQLIAKGTVPFFRPLQTRINKG